MNLAGDTIQSLMPPIPSYSKIQISTSESHVELNSREEISVANVGKGKIFPYPSIGSSSRFNQIDMRQINKIIKLNYIRMCGNPTYMRESEIPHAGEVQRPKVEMRFIWHSELRLR